MRESFTIQAHSFKDLEPAQQKKRMAEKVGKAWHQFQHVCGSDVDTAHVEFYSDAMNFDHMIVISSKKHVLGFALLSEEKIKYDGPTLSRLRKNKDTFDEDKTLNIKLLCSRTGSGIGTRIMRVCENVAKHYRCASLHLEAATTAYKFYKKMGFDTFRRAFQACNPDNHPDHDGDKFETAMLNMNEAVLQKKKESVEKAAEDRKNNNSKKGKGKKK